MSGVGLKRLTALECDFRYTPKADSTRTLRHVRVVPTETRATQDLPACFEQETQGDRRARAVKQPGHVVNPSAIV